MSRSRDIAAFLGKTEIANTENNALLNTTSPTGLDSAQVSSIAASSGLTVYSTLNDLPSSGLTSGDQAFVSSTSRFYISNGSGWYNVALINATPSLTISPEGAIELAVDGSTPTVITLTATDSDNPIAALTYTVESDGNFAGLGTISQDSSVFTITPLSEDSATTETSTLTFKASDGISFGSGTRTFTLTFAAQITQNSKYTTLLAKADTAGTDNQADASTNGFTITEVGNVTSTALSPYHPGGYSIYLDGVDDYLGIDAGYIATNGSWWNSTGFTLETWFYKTASTGAGASTILDNRQSSSTGMLFQYLADGYTLYSNGGYQFQSVGTEKINQWVHLALVISGTSLTLYEDGTSIHTDTVASTASYQYFGRSQNTIGAIQYSPRGTNVEFPGYFYDFRISVGSRYTTAFTPPTEPHVNDSDTVLLMGSSPMLIDKSSNNHTIISFGNTSTKKFSPYDYIPYTKTDHGGSVYFDGAGDYLTAGSASNSGLSGTFTIEFWMYLTTDYTVASQTLVSNYDGGATNWYIQQRSDGNLWLGASIGTPLAYNLSPKSNTWYHIAFSNNSSSNTGKLFVNGIEVDNHTGDLYNSAHMAASAYPITIGRLGNNTGSDFAGYIADLRIIDGTMLYTSNFTPPTAPLTAITNTKLLTCTNKNNIWDAGSGLILYKSGNATASNTQRKFATSSAMYFDGTSDYVHASDMGLGGANAFTIEAWMYPTVYNTYANDMYSHGANLSVGADFLAFGIKPDGNLQMFKGSGSPVLLSTSAPCASLNQWYHIAFVRESNNNTSAYVNGVLVAGPTAISGALTYAPTGRAFIGTQSYSAGASDRSFEGYIQDVRITNGFARYTSAFTPPTAEFTG